MSFLNALVFLIIRKSCSFIKGKQDKGGENNKNKANIATFAYNSEFAFTYVFLNIFGLIHLGEYLNFRTM